MDKNDTKFFCQLDFFIGFFFIACVFAGVYKSAPYFDFVPLDLTLLFGIITIALIILVVILRKEIEVSKTSLIISSTFFIFLFYALVSGFWSPSDHYFLSKSLRLVTATTLAIILSAIIISSSRRRLSYAGLSTFGLATITAIEMLHQFRLTGGHWELEPFATNYLITGRVVGFGILLGLSYLIFYDSEREKRIFVSLCIILMVSALLVSGARGPIVSTIISITSIIILIFIDGKISHIKYSFKTYVVGTTGSILTILLAARETRAFRRFRELLDGGGSSMQQRLHFYETTIDQLELSTLVFGHGWASWPVSMGYDDGQHYPHNIFLEIIFELGLIGLVILVILIIYPLYKNINQIINLNDKNHIIILSLFIYTFINAMVTGDINENRYLFAVLGLMAYTTKND